MKIFISCNIVRTFWYLSRLDTIIQSVIKLHLKFESAVLYIFRSVPFRTQSVRFQVWMNWNIFSSFWVFNQLDLIFNQFEHFSIRSLPNQTQIFNQLEHFSFSSVSESVRHKYSISWNIFQSVRFLNDKMKHNLNRFQFYTFCWYYVFVLAFIFLSASQSLSVSTWLFATRRT